MKRCFTCKEFKSIDFFQKDKQKKDGLRPYCKQCQHKKNTTQEYREKRKHPKYHVIKMRHRVKKYGITLNEYDALIKNQNGLCAICNNPETSRDRKNGTLRSLAVDHSHINNKVRGLLCSNCNRGLGFFKDNANFLIRASEYVSKNT